MNPAPTLEAKTNKVAEIDPGTPEHARTGVNRDKRKALEDAMEMAWYAHTNAFRLYLEALTELTSHDRRFQPDGSPRP